MGHAGLGGGDLCLVVLTSAALPKMLRELDFNATNIPHIYLNIGINMCVTLCDNCDSS